MDIDFKEIKSIGQGKRAAFEELCCQLARRSEPGPLVRLRGDGGDGGIECYVELPDGKRGWQAKYVFQTSRLLTQASKSFRTALKNHPDLRSFVLCFPFDPTGKTGRGEGDDQKFKEWKASELHHVDALGRRIEIELWSASELRARIVDDKDGGMRRFFFGTQTLTDRWFKEHLDQAMETAGPRYTPEVNVSTDMAKWFEAFGRTDHWSNALLERLISLEERISHVRDALGDERRVKTEESDSPWGTWPNDLRRKVAFQAAAIQEAMGTLRSIMHLNREQFLELKRSLQSFSDELRSVNRKYGGVPKSSRWRESMAESQASMPLTNLDSTRDLVTTLDTLAAWLDSHEFSLGLETAFLLTGAAGSGKTHGVCDIARERQKRGLRTCLLFGHQFGDGPDPWTTIAEVLGFADLGREQLLDTMNSAGETSGAPLVVCVDAVNETKPSRYWCHHLSALLQPARSRPFLRVCVVCRTRYVPTCLPTGHQLHQVEHHGFSGRERDAYYRIQGLHPPAMPILRPEDRNPLHLRLVCEVACSSGLSSVPVDWAGTVPAMEAFLQDKERRFAEWHELPPQASTMRKTLKALVDHLVGRAVTEVSWPTAVEVVLERVVGLDVDQASRNLEWLVAEDLLIDAPRDQRSGAQSTLRLAYDRLADFLIADDILASDTDYRVELAPWIGTTEDIKQNSGVLRVLSALLPERRDGSELPDLEDDPEKSEALLKPTMEALSSRSVFAFSDRTDVLVRRASGVADLYFLTMESLVSIARRPSSLDAHWLDDLLRSKSLAERDAQWCAFLHDSFSKGHAVAELIEAAFDLAFDDLGQAVTERWAKVLIWFTAAADRRVKDRATRAAVAVLAGSPTILPKLVETMLSIDDDAVRERVLLITYGTLLQTRHSDTLGRLAIMLHRRYTDDPSAFANGLIRDHIRAVCDLAEHLDVLPDGIDAEFASQPIEGQAWPLPLPSEDDVNKWGELVQFWPDVFRSDFFKYSMWRMDRWEHGMSRADMAKWMLQAIALDLEFVGSGCERYDERMLQEHGGGRGKPVWAERIGKKYTWVAMQQLASRLHDNVVPKEGRWESERIRTPLALAEERQLDPSLLRSRDLSKRHRFFRKPLLVTGGADDQEWVALEEDIPRIGELVEIQFAHGQNWRPLVAYLSSVGPRDYRRRAPYRQIWIHLYGYLVPSSDAVSIFERLSGRNFFGQWMPECSQVGSLEGFAAEYPWAALYNEMLDEWYQHPADVTPEILLPAWNPLSCEWEYDASLEDVYASVPARIFFEGDDLWWDGSGGYKRSDGRTVFLDPSVGLAGPSTLLADTAHLCARLRQMDRCLIWTLLGEKGMIGGRSNKADCTPIRIFCQVAYMDADGASRESALVFFDDETDQTGLA